MALIKCAECGREVSERAQTCPSCAYPLQAVTIQATAKQWKGAELASVAAILLGTVMAFGGIQPYFGVIVMICGFTGWIGARVGAWWHHG